MEAVQDIQMAKVSNSFINHMFTFKKAEKAEIYNLIQYPFLAILPLIVLIRINQNFWAKVEAKKGNVELLAEIIGEMVINSLIVFFVFRILEYIPTFSGEPLKSINILTVITALIIGLPWYDKDSNIGNKVKIVYNRINDSLPSFLASKLEPKPKKKNKQANSILPPPTHQQSRADSLGGHPPQFVEKPSSPSSFPSPNLGPSNTQQQQQPMATISAANEVLGGFGGSVW